uniref:Ribonuclease HII n=1 Tax=viral metagenome TaxID=1070528 RepID=A0A6C0HDJ0_9ZZZZ
MENPEQGEPIVILLETEKPKKRAKAVATILKKCYDEANPQTFEVGVDEVGRGPLFGRVYSAAVILPKDDSFDHSKMKDSKKFHSKKKIQEVADYIKKNAIAWSVEYEDEKTIDNINILQASQSAMHKCIAKVIKTRNPNEIKLLIDGNYFNPYTIVTSKTKIEHLDHICIEGGDNKYSSIAAASILAKVERDQYIEDLCEEHPDLIEKYSLDSNKGYGSRKHIEGIKQHGITIWHRRSFGICKDYV